MKTALITGITGQDGSYLADFLLEKGYTVHGLRRRSSTYNLGNIAHISENLQDPFTKFFLHYADLSDSSSLNRLIEKIKPNEIYNLAAQSHVHTSFQIPEYTAEVDAVGTVRILDAIKETGVRTKFYQASSSELYGKAIQVPQNEDTPFNPQSPYAVSKLFAHWITKNYRDAYNIFACNGILFNHESPRRTPAFVTRKITEAAAKILTGKMEKLYLGNINASRDWGYAKDYVEAMWLMLQQPEPDDYVIATGETHTVKEFVEKVFNYIDKEIYWEGVGLNEKGIEKKTNKILVEIDPYYFRPTEVEYLLGDSSKARKKLNWVPRTNFDELVKIMIESDLRRFI